MKQEQQSNNLPIELSSMTWEQFYEKYRPEELFNLYWSVNTVSQSLSKTRFTLKNINDTFGYYQHKKFGKCECGILYYYMWLDYLNRISNVSKPLPPESMGQLARWLYVKYYTFYLSDLKIILEGILEKKYGMFFGSVDAQLIMSAFKEYAESRRQKEYDMLLKNR